MTKKEKEQLRAAQAKQDDAAIYRLLTGIIVACLAMTLIRIVDINYASTLSLMYPIYQGCGIAAIVLVIAGIVCAVLAKKNKRKRSGGMLAVFSVTAFLYAASAFLLHVLVLDAPMVLYVAWCAAILLYAVWLLYQHEFFFISLIAAVSAFLCFAASRVSGMGVLFGAAILIALLAVLVIAVLALGARKAHGRVKIFGQSIEIYRLGSPMPILVTCALWTVLCAAAIVLSGTAASYLVFAAAAYEIICGIWYTIKLV